jgi:hypothetical protein
MVGQADDATIAPLKSMRARRAYAQLRPMAGAALHPRQDVTRNAT